MNKWNTKTWEKFEAKHLPEYPDKKELEKVVKTISGFPPLVFAGEVKSLKQKLAEASEGRSFLLQGGDCAESFSEFSANNIRDTFRVLLQMAVILTAGIGKPVIKMGRIAGQFAKPRSSPYEMIGDKQYESYKGDIINDISLDEDKRAPNPMRMIQAYSQSASTLNLIRAFAVGGYADLHLVHSWNMGYTKDGKQQERYGYLANKIKDSLKFIEALGINSNNTPQLKEIEYFTSHEMLLLPYEQAMTRLDSTYGEIYDTSAHFLWIGDRTRFPGSAHVEFCRGINNPIGIKCGPSLNLDDIIEIIDTLNPNNQAGRINLITRYGHDKVSKYLPKLVKRIQKEGKTVLWICDPMHGNTIKSDSGYKTRPFDYILSEVKQCAEIHRGLNSYLGGVHLEMTGQNVTECTGGVVEVLDEHLKDRYHTHCDPRLNANQAIELAFLLSDNLV